MNNIPTETPVREVYHNIVVNWNVINYVWCERFLLEHPTEYFNQVDVNGNTIINNCISILGEDFVDTLPFYIAKGLDFAKRDSNGATPLLCAVQLECTQRTNMLRIIDSLLKISNQVDVPDNMGWTPLMVACYCNNEPLVELLLENNANANIVNNDGNTAIMLSFLGSNTAVLDKDKYEYLDIIKLLANNKIGLFVRNLKGDNLLSFAIKNYKNTIAMPVIRLILSHETTTRDDILAKNKYGICCIIAAADTGYNPLIKLLQDYTNVQ